MKPLFSSMRYPFSSGIVCGLIAGVCLTFIVPSLQYRYDTVSMGPGISMPVREHRITGKTEILFGLSGWEEAKPR